MRERLEEAAREVYDELGSGWSESIYHRSLERELSERQIPFHSEGTVPVMYKGAPVGRRRPDMFIVPEHGDTVIVELKAGSNSGTAQLNQYLNLTEADRNLGKIRGGAVIRFNDEFEMEFIELGPETNPDDEEMEYEYVTTTPIGIDVYKVYKDGEEVQVNVDETMDSVSVDGEALERKSGFNQEAEDFIEQEVLYNDED